MPAAPWMLVTRHQDRPGTMGRIGQMLGEADVNISAMQLGRNEPRGDALMILALDEAVPNGVAERIRADEAVLDLWLIRPRLTPLRLTGVTGTLVLVRHGESTWIAEGRFQGRQDPPLSELGVRQAGLVAGRLAERGEQTPLPIPPGPPIGIWHSPLDRAATTAQRHRRCPADRHSAPRRPTA